MTWLLNTNIFYFLLEKSAEIVAGIKVQTYFIIEMTQNAREKKLSWRHVYLTY